MGVFELSIGAIIWFAIGRLHAKYYIKKMKRRMGKDFSYDAFRTGETTVTCVNYDYSTIGGHAASLTFAGILGVIFYALLGDE